jgi:hypothetical protein
MEHQPSRELPRLPLPVDIQLIRAATAGSRERIHLRKAIDAVLRTNSDWREGSLRLGDTPHFARYRSRQYRARYDRALNDLGIGSATATELELIRSLSAEIASSPVVISSGQVLLSGEIREAGLKQNRWEPFVWATVHPISAVERAESQLGGGSVHLPTVYVLQLDHPMPVLIGRAGSHGRWDLLLPRRLRIIIKATREYSGLMVKEAVVGV